MRPSYPSEMADDSLKKLPGLGGIWSRNLAENSQSWDWWIPLEVVEINARRVFPKVGAAQCTKKLPGMSEGRFSKFFSPRLIST